MTAEGTFHSIEAGPVERFLSGHTGSSPGTHWIIATAHIDFLSTIELIANQQSIRPAA
jgi:hypothetical protein